MTHVTSFPEFAVACGEEASDPMVHHDGRLVRVDELRASGHLERQDDDLAAVAALGVRLWRYGMPWRRSEPEPGVYDWTLWDHAFAACDRMRPPTALPPQYRRAAASLTTTTRAPPRTSVAANVRPATRRRPMVSKYSGDTMSTESSTASVPACGV